MIAWCKSLYSRRCLISKENVIRHKFVVSGVSVDDNILLIITLLGKPLPEKPQPTNTTELCPLLHTHTQIINYDQCISCSKYLPQSLNRHWVRVVVTAVVKENGCYLICATSWVAGRQLTCFRCGTRPSVSNLHSFHWEFDNFRPNCKL